MDEGEQWFPDTDYLEWAARDVNAPYAMPLGLLIYKSLLDDYGPKTLPAFEPAWSPQLTLRFHAGQGLAEIGMIQQLMQHAASQKGSLEPAVMPSTTGIDWGEVGEGLAWAVGAAAAIAVYGVVARGAKGGAFRTALKYGWDPKGRSPMWSVTKGVSQLLADGYVPKGSQIVKERTTFGEVTDGEFGVGSAFAHGITGYI